MRTAAESRNALRRLARDNGIQLSYTANDGRRVRTSTESLEATLGALGVDVPAGGIVRAGDGVDPRNQRVLEPVIVAMPASGLSSAAVVPAACDLSRCELTVAREDGQVFRLRLSDAVSEMAPPAGGGDSVLLHLDLDQLDLPAGYHELGIHGDGISATALLLVPPRQALAMDRSFGVFAPLYALRGETDWGVGSFRELGRLADHVGEFEGALLGTLPMFPAFFAAPVDPSPYLPVSRLFVNELFVDIETLPEFAVSAEAAALVDSTAFRRDLKALNALAQVDYAGAMAQKRMVMQLCAEELFNGGSSPRRNAFESFLAGHPELDSYADFRATAERRDASWREWPSAAGTLPDAPVDSAARRYHLYSQFVAAEQLAAAADTTSGRAGLYLDLPIGVHPDGFDTWTFAELFAPATVGAPPDRLAPQGQAWGFPPLHPQRIREDRYRYVIESYRRLLANAKAIRIDHVLGLQRLFWIPPGAGAESGAYVRYRSEELRAIVAIEAARAGAVVVGEDLGTVSADIRHAMDRDGMLHTFVYQFAASPSDPLPQPESPSLASLGSHDLPRFAAYWQGLDIEDRVARGLLSESDAAAEQRDRQALVSAVTTLAGDDTVASAFALCIGSLAEGPAAGVLIDLADIEAEEQPDNRPGTGPEADNWRWRLSRPLESIINDQRVAGVLTTVADKRRLADPQGVST